MKITFDFDIPEEREDYEIYSAAYKMYRTLTGIREELRRMNKYGDPDATITAEKLQAKFFQMLTDNKLNEVID